MEPSRKDPCPTPSRPTSRGSSIIFECKNNNDWSVCWSTKHKQLYYHNKNIFQSFWTEPDCLSFTDQELKIVKFYKKKSISKPVDKSKNNQDIRIKKMVKSNLAIDHKSRKRNDCDKLNTSYEGIKRNCNETSDTNKAPEIPSLNADKKLKSILVKPDVGNPLQTKLFESKNCIHSPFEKQNVNSGFQMKVSKRTYNYNELSKKNCNLQHNKHERRDINPVSSKQKSDKSCPVETRSYKISQTVENVSTNSTEFHNNQYSTQQSIIKEKNEFVELDLKKQPFSTVKNNQFLERNWSKELHQAVCGSKNKELQEGVEIQDKEHYKSSTGNAQRNFLSDLEEMDWEDCSDKINLDSQILESKTSVKQQFQDCNDVNLSSSDFKPHLIIVVDSHVLIYNIRILQHLINTPPNEFPAAFVIPYGVLTELDTLKQFDHDNSNSAFQKRLRYTISLVQSILLSQHSRVIGQKAKDSEENTGDFKVQDVSSLIINCCLQYQNKGHNVVLFTHNKLLKIKAERLKISHGNKTKLIKELKIVSVMKQHGILDEMQDNQFHKCPGETDIVSENCLFHITQTFKHQLQEYLTTVLNKGMFEYYGAELYQKRFFFKPPWTLQEVCINLRTHWFALKNVFITEESKRCNNTVIRLLSNINSTKWTENTVGELLDAVSHITSQLEKNFFSETRLFNEHLKETVNMFKKEMGKYKLLISVPYDALLEEKNKSYNTDYIFPFLLSKLKQKSDQVCAYLQFEAKTDTEKTQEYITFLQESGKEVVLYRNCVANIVKGVQGMINHQSLIISLTEPFVLCFEEGLKSIITLDLMYNPQSTVKDASINITPKSVVKFLHQIQNSGLLPNMLTEAQTIHDVFNNFVSFASEATRVMQ